MIQVLVAQLHNLHNKISSLRNRSEKIKCLAVMFPPEFPMPSDNVSYRDFRVWADWICIVSAAIYRISQSQLELCALSAEPRNNGDILGFYLFLIVLQHTSPPLLILLIYFKKYARNGMTKPNNFRINVTDI